MAQWSPLSNAHTPCLVGLHQDLFVYEVAPIPVSGQTRLENKPSYEFSGRPSPLDTECGKALFANLQVAQENCDVRSPHQHEKLYASPLLYLQGVDLSQHQLHF